MPSRPKGKGRKGSQIKGRTARACDRCKLKKSKCDGTENCRTCKSSDNPCMYTARRKREVTGYYWRMREITDEALQRLYWACRRQEGFPGTLPDESRGNVTTNEILKGLGLIEPDLKSLSSPEDLKQSTHLVPPSTNVDRRQQLQLTELLLAPAEMKAGSILLPSPSLNLLAPLPGHNQTQISNTTAPELPIPLEVDIGKEVTPCHMLSKTSLEGNEVVNQQDQDKPTHHISRTDSFFNENGLCKPNSWNMSTNKQCPPSFCVIHQPDFEDTQLVPHPPEIVCDSFLPPWPGSLEAAYQGKGTFTELQI